MAYRHIPVMVDEVLRHLNPVPGDICVDATLGGTGHARQICKHIVPGGVLIGIDQDSDAVAHARESLSNCGADIHLLHGNFADLPQLLTPLGVVAIDKLLLDLGISLDQIRASGRGFSFNADEPLDMRMNTATPITAAQIVNTLPPAKLAALFSRLGEERYARRIAQRITLEREKTPIANSRQLAAIVAAAMPAAARRKSKIHPATRVFMALRIAVNRELERLESVLEALPGLMRSGGRICILSFHSLEDRIVKQRFAGWIKGCQCPPDLPVCGCGQKPLARRLTGRVVRPGDAEVAVNPMARSTRLRAIEWL
jgi:16S rRNA (cytosine1402-N4)-methyltransferase